ncbi:MAG: tRNA nucleotidyltransferase (CCA-adding enzyme), partial [Candidatus Krumholzibacteriia bacterium]
MSLIYPAEWNPLPADLAEPLVRICRLVEEAGGQVWLVGGSVRDLAMQRQLEDLDLEVFGLPAEDLQACLAKSFELDLVGVSFGILKLRGLPIDVGLPRSETKSGHGHRGFAISADPELPLERAAARRDFTVNAI